MALNTTNTNTSNSSGRLLEQTPTARQPGTTVHITHLFAPLPVRRAEFQRTVARHSARLLRVLQAYALMALGVRLACSNVKGAKGNRWVGARVYVCMHGCPLPGGSLT